MADDVERTEEPTPKRRQEARRRGEIAVSQEIFVFANLLLVTLALMVAGQHAVQAGIALLGRLWVPRTDLEIGDAVAILGVAFGSAARVLAPILIAAFVAALVAGFSQTRFNIATRKLRPKFGKLNPIQGFSRIFKKSAPIELPKSLLKLAIVAGTMGFAIFRHIEELRSLPELTLYLIVAFQMRVVIEAMLAGSLTLILIASIDYAYQYWQTEKSLKMSKSEVKDEMRQNMGDPAVRSRIRSLQLDRARTRMMEAVPTADVVVTNPEHISVALAYERAEMQAPTVVAKGGGHVAMRIRQIAREHGIPIVENRPLARTLFRSVRVGDSIPERLYQAVAEILAHVYRLDRRRGAAW